MIKYHYIASFAPVVFVSENCKCAAKFVSGI